MEELIKQITKVQLKDLENLKLAFKNSGLIAINNDLQKLNKAKKEPSKIYRKFDFQIETKLIDYLDHQIFLTGIRDKKDYLNHLIEEDMRKRLNVKENEDLIDKWYEYKEKNIPKGLK